jgi:hypothetical protein
MSSQISASCGVSYCTDEVKNDEDKVLPVFKHRIKADVWGNDGKSQRILKLDARWK